MHKKRSRQAQVTIFLIIGVLVVAAFLFVIFLTTSLTKSKLTQAEEELQLKSFQKEALRIYMDDCLSDELEVGLILLGKQGRIWDDQPGGRKFFEEGRSGVTVNPTEEFSGYATGRVFYGIAGEQERYFQYQDSAYPCNSETGYPAFCQYTFPNTSVGFGVLQLRPSTLEADLKRFLENRTLDCVQQWIITNISGQAVLEQTELKLELKVLNDGIGADVEYPLKFKVGGQDFFHLTTFDFFYPTQFKRLLDSAVMFPLQWDQKFVDFPYTENQLKLSTFTYESEEGPQERSLLADVYKMLSLQMKTTALPNGDDLLEFTTPIDTIIRHQPYTFRIARQNRPPALEYVNNDPCLTTGYDYLVVPEKEGLNDLIIMPSAKDPDEDMVTFSIEATPNQPSFDFLQTKLPTPLPTINFPAVDWPKGLYFITVKASDEHEARDEQVVRVLVDRQMAAALRISLPYSIPNPATGIVEPYNEVFKGDTYWVSAEDPVFLEFSLPEASLAPDQAIVSGRYTDPSHNEPIGLTQFYYQGTNTEICLNFPHEVYSTTNDPSDYTCNYLNDYTKQDLNNKFQSKQQPFFNQPTDQGKLTFDFGINYCGNNEQHIPLEADIVVKACTPAVNPEHPYPYISGDTEEYYQYKFGLDADRKTNFDAPQGKEDSFSPFNATHTCCKPADWTVKLAGASCFTADNPAPETLGCFGGSTEAGGDGQGTMGTKGYLLEKRTMVAECDGARGNVCNFKGFTYGFEGVCGGKAADGTGVEGSGEGNCDKVAEKCKGKGQFYYEPAELGKPGFWCHGEKGCGEHEQECKSEIVDITVGINLATYSGKYTITQFRCGCIQSDPPTKGCIHLQDGIIGTCKAGVCKQ